MLDYLRGMDGLDYSDIHIREDGPKAGWNNSKD